MSVIRFVLCAAFFVVLVGCGGKGVAGRLAINGTVSYAGEQVKKGSITFRPTDPASPEASAAIVDGAYKVPAQLGPKVGDYLVKIVAHRMKKDPKPYAPSYLKDDPNAGMVPEQYLPSKYNEKSTLNVKFDAAKEKYDFALEK